MNTSKLLLTLCAVGVGGALTSCVDPYHSTGHDVGHRYSQTTVTHYRPGYVVSSLPSRYETELIGGVQYYRSENVYYRPQGNRYVVVESPRGPRGRNNRGGYDRRGDDRRGSDSRTDWRRESDRPSRYDRRETRIVRTLPSGARMVTLRGSRYYQHNNVYYRPEGSGFVIVERPY